MGGTMLWASRFPPVPEAKESLYAYWAEDASRLPDGSWDGISGASARGLVALGERYGISEDEWPIYWNIEADGDIPLEEVVELCDQLRESLQRIPREELEAGFWSRRVWSEILSQGLYFFVKAV